MIRRKSKLINADRLFVTKIRDFQDRVKENFGVKISDAKTTELIAEKLDIEGMFDPFQEKKKRKSKRLLDLTR